MFFSAPWKFLFFIRNNFLYANFPFHSLWSKERQLSAVLNFKTIDSFPVNNCWSWICLRRAKQIPLWAILCIFLWSAEFNLLKRRPSHGLGKLKIAKCWIMTWLPSCNWSFAFKIFRQVVFVQKIHFFIVSKKFLK